MAKLDSNTDARIRRSRRALIEAGRDLLNQNYETSLSDIARQADVGRTTLYRLFQNKGELTTAIALDCLEAFDHATAHIESEAESALDAIRLLFRATMPLHAEMQFLMNLDYFEWDDPELDRIYQRQNEEICALIELAKQEGSIDKNLPTDWLVHALEAYFYPAWMLREAAGYSDDRLAELAFRGFSRGAQP